MAVFPDPYKHCFEILMIDTFKSVIDALSTPTVSFTLLTIFIPLVFPPTDLFDKINRKFGIWRLWTKPGLIGGMGFITFFFIVGYFDKNFNITLTKPDNFPAVRENTRVLWMGSVLRRDSQALPGVQPPKWTTRSGKP